MPDRAKLVLEFWDRKDKLSIKNKEYKDFVEKFFYFLLKQDIKGGDITTNCLIKKNKKISAVIVAKEEGIVAGLEEFSLINNDFKIKFLKKDGDKIKSGDILAEIKGNAGKILEKERVSLNLLQRMGGIATNVDRLNKKLDNKIKLAATRKTLWGLLDKKAVSIGHGLTHRLNLNDGILIKDNHLKTLNWNFEKALESVKNKSKHIEIEVEDKNQTVTAAKAIKKIIGKNDNNKNIFAVMLDKIPPAEIKSVVSDLRYKKLYDYVLLEASGNINPGNLVKYKDCGVDVISMGCITNSAKILNMSLEVK